MSLDKLHSTRIISTRIIFVIIETRFRIDLNPLYANGISCFLANLIGDLFQIQFILLTNQMPYIRQFQAYLFHPLGLWIFFCSHSYFCFAQPPAFTGELQQNNDSGYLTLNWETQNIDSSTNFKIQRSQNPEFPTLETIEKNTADTKMFFSGLRNGTYYFRVSQKNREQDKWGPWSKVLMLQVTHPSESMAIGLFSIGAFCFVSILIFLSRSYLKFREWEYE